MVDVVGVHHHAAELLDDVAVLVGGLRAGERAEAPAVAREPLGGRVERLVPRDRVPLRPSRLTIGADDAVARVDEAGAEAALDAEHALGSTRWRGRRRPSRPAGWSSRTSSVDAAADAAVRAGGLDPPHDRRRRLLGPERAGRARGHALAARGAHRRRHERRRRTRRPSWRGRARASRWRRSAARRRRPWCSARRGCTPRGRARRSDLDASVSKWWSAGEARRRETVARGGGADLAEAVAAAPRRQHRAGEVEDRGADARGLGMRRCATTMPSRAGRWQAAGVPRMPSTWTRQVRQAPSGGRSGSLQSCGSGDAEAVDRVEHGGAGVELDRPIVDDQLHGGLIIKDKPAPGNRVSGVRDARRYNTPAHRRTSR